MFQGRNNTCFIAEMSGTTSLGMNITISSAVNPPVVVFGIKRGIIDWKSMDGTNAKLIF